MSDLLQVISFQEHFMVVSVAPAVIKMVLDFYGIEKTEAEVAELSNKEII